MDAVVLLAFLRRRVQNTVTTTRITMSIIPTVTAIPMMTPLEGCEEEDGAGEDGAGEDGAGKDGAEPAPVVGVAVGGGAPADCVVLSEAALDAPVVGAIALDSVEKPVRVAVTSAVKSAVTSLGKTSSSLPMTRPQNEGGGCPWPDRSLELALVNTLSCSDIAMLT